MNYFNRLIRLAGATALVALMSTTAAQAQVTSPKITVTNTSPAKEIGIEAGSNVEFASNGDLLVRCRQSGSDCVTANFGGGGTGTNPPTNVFLTPSTTTLTTGQPFNLTWGSTNAQVCYGVGPTSPSVSGWTNQVLTATRGAPGLSLTLAEGTYVFTIRCYNASGSATAMTSTITVNPGGGGGATGYCAEYYDNITRPTPTDPRFTAYGFVRVDVPFQSVWGVEPGIGVGPAVGVPGNFVNPAAGRYMSIPFSFDTANQLNLQFLVAQNTGISTGAISLSISPCPGDFRPRSGQPPANDVYLAGACGLSATSVNGGLSAAKIGSGLFGCPVPQNKIMYINIAASNMYLPAAPTSTSCGSEATCGVNMTAQ